MKPDQRERLPALKESEMSPAQLEAMREIIEGPRGRVGGPFNALLRCPELTRRVQGLGEHVRFNCPIPRDLAELAVLITARHWTQRFEWEAHRREATKAGLRTDVIVAVAEGRRPESMSDQEAYTYEFCTEFLQNKSVSDFTFFRFKSAFGEPGVVEIIALIGYYALIAGIMNVARTAPLDHGAPELVALPH